MSSVIVVTRPATPARPAAARFVSACTIPAGHNTRTTSARARAPRPKTTSAGVAGGVVAVVSILWRRLPERRAAGARHDLERGIMPQAVRIVDVFVARRDLVEALARQRRDIVRDVPPISRIGDSVADVGAEAQLLVEFSDAQQTGVRS